TDGCSGAGITDAVAGDARGAVRVAAGTAWRPHVGHASHRPGALVSPRRSKLVEGGRTFTNRDDDSPQRFDQLRRLRARPRRIDRARFLRARGGAGAGDWRTLCLRALPPVVGQFSSPRKGAGEGIRMLIRAALVMFAVSWTGYWIAGLAVAVLFLIWALLSTAEGPPVLALALTYQWMQVTIGLFYSTLTGEQREAMYQTDWHRMMLIGLGWVTCLAVAMCYGIVLTGRRIAPSPDAPVRAVSAKVLYIAYAASLLLTGVVQEIAWNYPMFTQAILAIAFKHLGLLFVLTRRFTRPHFQWEKLAILMAIEIAVGFTGYFAGFREPIVMGGIAILEVFDRRDIRHWLFAGMLAVVLGLSSLIWMSVRGQLRQEIDDELLSNSRIERFDRARTLSTGLLTQAAADYREAADRLIDRLWAIKYPAMALDRVPASVPHTDGDIMRDAVTHLVTP